MPMKSPAISSSRTVTNLSPSRSRPMRSRSKCAKFWIASFLFGHPLPKRLQSFDVIEDDLERAGYRNRKDQTHRAPDPSPNEQSDCHDQGIELEPLADNFWKQHVDADDVQA